ncbi:hypothetical protein [Saccharothrix obliqua]|uniref:hypothetical protein n=1 Tax=Saccharothrix obliqua TaxID=2861747 RepID=UPI0027E2880A|nr:hypothetical protein [Saccharothrix obliqua]
MIVGVVLGAVLGAAWWGVRELIASGAVCSKDDWGCLSAGVVAVPVGVVVGVLVGWAVLAALHVTRPLGMAAVGVGIAAVLALGTTWVAFPASAVLAGAVGFALAAPLTAHRN